MTEKDPRRGRWTKHEISGYGVDHNRTTLTTRTLTFFEYTDQCFTSGVLGPDKRWGQWIPRTSDVVLDEGPLLVFHGSDQRDVAHFMVEMKQVVRERPTALETKELALRIELVREEFQELVRASTGLRLNVTVTDVGGYKDDTPSPPDLPATADALADLLYVIHGWACMAGIDMKPIWEEVHAANMRKIGGPIRADGKRLKPPGWRGPDVAARLREQGWEEGSSAC